MMNTFGGLDAVLTALNMAREITGETHDGGLIRSLRSHGHMSTFADVVDAAATRFDEFDGWTLLAPTDDVFRDHFGIAGHRPVDPGYADQLLRRHLIPRFLSRERIWSAAVVTTLDGQPLRIESIPGLGVNGAHLGDDDIRYRNGIVYAINRLLLPH